MCVHDRALVVGIRRYRDSPVRWLNDLQGADNDADAISAWLKKPDGGGLPDSNVRVIRSADLPDPFPNEASLGPVQRAVEDELHRLTELPANAFDGQFAGRRLYVYVSGHGFARDLDETALVTAEAKKEDPCNVLVSSWMD